MAAGKENHLIENIVPIVQSVLILLLLFCFYFCKLSNMNFS